MLSFGDFLVAPHFPQRPSRWSGASNSPIETGREPYFSVKLRTEATEECFIYGRTSKGAGDDVGVEVFVVGWARLLSAQGRNQCVGLETVGNTVDVGLQHPLEGHEVKVVDL